MHGHRPRPGPVFVPPIPSRPSAHRVRFQLAALFQMLHVLALTRCYIHRSRRQFDLVYNSNTPEDAHLDQRLSLEFVRVGLHRFARSPRQLGHLRPPSLLRLFGRTWLSLPSLPICVSDHNHFSNVQYLVDRVRVTQPVYLYLFLGHQAA